MVLDTRQQLIETISETFPNLGKRKTELIYELVKPRRKNKGAYKMDQIIRLSCRFFNVRFSEIKKRSNKREIVDMRHMMLVVVKKYSRCSLETIAERFDRHHATVIHASRKIKNLCKTDENFRRTYEGLNNYILR